RREATPLPRASRSEERTQSTPRAFRNAGSGSARSASGLVVRSTSAAAIASGAIARSAGSGRVACGVSRRAACSWSCSFGFMILLLVFLHWGFCLAAAAGGARKPAAHGRGVHSELAGDLLVRPARLPQRRSSRTSIRDRTGGP